MSNAAASPNVSSPATAQHMGAGNFFGAIHGKREQCGAIFTDVRHSAPRKLPMHSHELSFIALLLDGSYGERCGRQQTQYGPFSAMFRPAGIPHQDEIGPNGVRLYEIDLRPHWLKRLADCSAALDTPRDDTRGGPRLWLGMKLFREIQTSALPEGLTVESLLAEILSRAARPSRRESSCVPGWVSRILDKLKAEHCRRLALDELAREAGVHPVHLLASSAAASVKALASMFTAFESARLASACSIATPRSPKSASQRGLRIKAISPAPSAELPG